MRLCHRAVVIGPVEQSRNIFYILDNKHPRLEGGAITIVDGLMEHSAI